MVSRILLTKISNVCSTVRRLSAIITIRPSIHPSIYPSIYPGSCSDPKWAGSPSLIPIRACLIPKSAHRDLEILVLEALSSVCLFFLLLFPGFGIRSPLFGVFSLCLVCAAAADLISVLFREALKICHLFPIESGFCESSIVARLVIASSPLSWTNCFYFAQRAGEKEAAGGPGSHLIGSLAVELRLSGAIW